MPQIILTADDFGRSPAINAAVVRAHREGMLTSASLMVTGEAAAEAVALARGMPGLAVGLHVVAVCGRAVLPHRDIPHLVDSAGRFRNDAVQAGLQCMFSRSARAELAREVAAQFECFAAAGLPFSHVDSHLHFHVHPVLFDLLAPLARQYGACGLRLPRDDLRLALSYSRERAGVKIVWSLIYALLCRWCMRRLAGRPPMVADRVYGLMQTGQMQEAYVLAVLRSLRVHSAELYFHPSIRRLGDEALGPNPGDLATLLSPTLRQVIAQQGIRTTTYAGLARLQA